MRNITLVFLITFCMTHCGQPNATPPVLPVDSHNPADEYATNNEDKFGFLVFDKKAVDSFFMLYEPLSPNNEKLRKACIDLLQKIDNRPPTDFAYGKHMDLRPINDDTSLARSILTDMAKNNNSKYFSEGTHYLFFQHCLPTSLKFRWAESYSGDYSFNITFFELLRRHCKTFDQHIYSEISYHEKKLEQIFGEWVYNEITAERAADIKSCITSNKAFADPLLKEDKDHFIEFLDHVIDGSWRLVLLDWN